VASKTIGIAGAGIVGRLIALALTRQGHQVTMFDRDPMVTDNLCDFAVDENLSPAFNVPDLNTKACSYTAAGMLTPFSEAEVAEPLVFELGMKSLQLWPELIKSLGSEVFYREGGTLVVAHRQDAADFNRFTASVTANVSPTEQQMTLIGQQQLTNLEPELATRFQQAAYMPDEAWLCACCVMPALAETLQKQRVAWHSSTNVLSVDRGEITVQARSGSRRHDFDWVIDCRGLGAKKQLPDLRGVRGEILWVRAPEVKINRLVRLMHPRYRIYIVPRRDDLYLIGATQVESEDAGPVTVRSSLELLSAAYSVHSGFGEAQVVYSDSNVRPALPDNQPQVLAEDGLIRVNGLFRHGYLMSPAIAEEVASFIEQENYQSSFASLFNVNNVCAA
jgi:glycine oxidase